MKPEQPEAHMRELESFRPLRIRSDTCNQRGQTPLIRQISI